VIRRPVKKAEAEIPAQGNIRLDALFDPPL